MTSAWIVFIRIILPYNSHSINIFKKSNHYNGGFSLFARVPTHRQALNNVVVDIHFHTFTMLCCDDGNVATAVTLFRFLRVTISKGMPEQMNVFSAVALFY